MTHTLIIFLNGCLLGSILTSVATRIKSGK